MAFPHIKKNDGCHFLCGNKFSFARSVFSFEESISGDMSVLISGVDDKAIWMLAYK